MERMGRFSHLGALIISVSTFLGFNLSAQNLLLNGDFEHVNWPEKVTARNASNFFARHWHRPSDGTVDVHRDVSTKSDSTKLYLSSMYVDAYSGDYCAGFISMNIMGCTEQFTGQLAVPLQTDSLYEIAFYLRYFGSTTPLVPNGIGYKMSTDSLLFDYVPLGRDEELPAPFYYSLFDQQKVFADYRIDDYVVDTSWKKYTSIYKATGGERFISFGIFAMENDAELKRQFHKLRSKPWKDYINKQYTKNKIIGFKRFNLTDKELDGDAHSYYLIDKISVKNIDKKQINVNNDLYLSNQNSDATTLATDTILYSGEMVVDRGFIGDMKVELNIQLRYMEKYVLRYGKSDSLIIANTDTTYKEQATNWIYTFECAAKKLRKSPLQFYASKLGEDELQNFLQSSKFDKKEISIDAPFSGFIFYSK